MMDTTSVYRFEPGKTYWTRSVCNHDCIFKIMVARRTAKTIVLGDGKRLKIFVWEGHEHVKPEGTYSMCPVIRAEERPVPNG
jgi:hypothetical protein